MGTDEGADERADGGEGGTPALHSPAWLLRGISSIPGELRLRAGTLSFVADYFGTAWPFQTRRLERLLGRPGLAAALEAGDEALVFAWPVDQVQVWCPWYYFGGGLKLRHEGLTLRFSFGRPANTEVNLGSSGTPLALPQAARNLGEIGQMRREGRRWQAALAEARRGGA